MEEMFAVEHLQNSLEFAKVNLYKFSTFNAKLHAKEYSHPMEIRWMMSNDLLCCEDATFYDFAESKDRIEDDIQLIW